MAVVQVIRAEVDVVLTPLTAEIVGGVVSEETVTVTTYGCVEASPAVTVYVCGVVKLRAIPVFGLTDAPVITMVGTSAVTFVPEGTVRAMVWAPSLIEPTTAGANPLKSKVVMAFDVLLLNVTAVLVTDVAALPAGSVSAKTKV